MNKMINYLKVAVTLLAFSLPMLIPVTAAAAAPCSTVQQNIAYGVSSATNNASCSTSGNDLTTGIGQVARTAVNILSIVVGAIAVIMIIYAGFRYITSGGDSNGVTSAKNTLIYAIVGIVIVALAQLIVHWVLNTTVNSIQG